MNTLSEINTWKRNFGLLPIHLSLESEDINNYILLNGGNGDFCFSRGEESCDPNDIYSKTWSSSTKNFVLLQNEEISVYNWKKREVEKIQRQLVEDNLPKFYEYLTLNNSSNEQDVVPYLIDIFKQFRNFTQERQNGTEALRLLFTLLAGLEEDDVYRLDKNKWGLPDVNIPTNFEQHIERLKNANYTPRLNLILRHSAGKLFQEAQKEVIFFDKQINLFGEYSGHLETKKNLYSSIHYTPSYLSRTITENTIAKIDLSKSKIKIFDPACGSAEFLIEALKQLAEKLFEGTIEIVGFDSSITAIQTSNFLLSYEKRTVWKDRLSFSFKYVNDSLEEEWDTDYDLILMNPPFISWEQLDKQARTAVKDALNLSKVGKPNIASAFFYKAIQSLNSDGAVGCVIPTSILTLDTYKELRSNAQEQISFDLIGKLGNFIFEDALTDVSILIGHKPKENTVPYVMWVKNESGNASKALHELRKMNSTGSLKVNDNNYSIYQPHTFPIAKENWKPVSYSENEQLKRLTILLAEKKLVPVHKIFSIKQGIRTGSNQVFIIPKEKFNGLPVEEQNFFKPSVDNESVESGMLKEVNYVWYPYSTEGILIKDEDELKNLVPEYYGNILLKNREALSRRARKNITNWWYLSEYRAWLTKQETRLVSTEFGGSNSFAIDTNGKFVVERGNGWIPKKDFIDDDYYFYLAIFSSSLFEKLLSIYSKQLAGGKWYDLGNKYTKDIPIPNVHDSKVKNSKGYLTLVGLGQDISNGYQHSKSILDNVLTEYYYPNIK